MQKIQAGETISAAYGFAFAGFLSVLGTVWLPLVIFGALSVGAILLLAPGLVANLESHAYELAVMQIARVGALIGLVWIVVIAMITVGLQERALGRVQGPTFVYFSLGAPVWRMIGAYLLLYVVLLVLFLITAGATAALAAASAHFIAYVGKVIAVLLVLTAVCWFIYGAVRLSFFLPTVVVAENHIGLAKAWELSAGNFWRIIGVVVVVLFPVAIGFSIVESAITGPFMMMDPGTPQIHPGMTPNEIWAYYGTLLKSSYQQLRSVWPFLLVLGIIRQVVFFGLGNAASAKAYLSVTEGHV